MARSTAALGVAAALLLLAGCGGHKADRDTANVRNDDAATTVEDTSPDSLAAPDNMTLDGESGDTGGNAADSDSTGTGTPANGS